MIVFALPFHILRSIDAMLVVFAIFVFPITLWERRGSIRIMEHTIAVWCLLVAVELILIQSFIRVLIDWEQRVTWRGPPMTIAGAVLILIYALVSRRVHVKQSESEKLDGEKGIK